jgi:hypothetical protein
LKPQELGSDVWARRSETPMLEKEVAGRHRTTTESQCIARREGVDRP